MGESVQSDPAETGHPEDDEQAVLDRRRFLTKATLAIGGALAAGWTVPAAVYVFGPARRSDRTEEWVSLGSANKVPPGSPTLFKATITRSTGWVTSEEEIAIYVITDDGRTFTGLSNVCTHLGCRVRWVADRGDFVCPCHSGVFNEAGQVVDGPPPRPLDHYEIRVENGQLQARLEV